MIQHLLMEYGFLVGLALLALNSIFLYRANFIIPSILIGASAFSMIALDFMHKITFSQELVTYSHDSQGQVLSANIELTIWQSASLWVNPVGIILIAVGSLILSKQLVTLNKRL